MQQRWCNAYVRRAHARRPLILVEDDHLDLTTLDLCPPGVDAFDVVVCSGPTGVAEECPLVVDGTCPAGRPDVVVSAFERDNPWAASVRAAWEQDGVPVAAVGLHEPPLVWPAHIGAGLRTLLTGDAVPDRE